MNRVAILTATFLIGVASTAVIATAKGGPGKHGGPRGVIMEQMFEEARIEKLDTDGDGQISLEEMQARDSRMDRMFEKLDADSDGSITKAEAEAAKAMRGHGHRNK